MYILIENDAEGVRYVCGSCKVRLGTQFDKICGMCGKTFNAIHSRIIGESEKYKALRGDNLQILSILDDPVELIGA